MYPKIGSYFLKCQTPRVQFIWIYIWICMQLSQIHTDNIKDSHTDNIKDIHVDNLKGIYVDNIKEILYVIV